MDLFQSAKMLAAFPFPAKQNKRFGGQVFRSSYFMYNNAIYVYEAIRLKCSKSLIFVTLEYRHISIRELTPELMIKNF